MYEELFKVLQKELGLNMYFRRMSWSEFKYSLKRKKVISTTDNTQLSKCLSTLDLTALGIGSTLGVGIYVLAGEVSKMYAGPAVIISFLIAAIASAFAGLCYAEFGARVPKAGSAYIYSYVSIGEFIAFVIGWNLILEYIIGSASVVKGLFTYLDALVDKAMSNFFLEHMPLHVDNISPFPDFFSLGVVLLFSVALAFGAKESTLVNNVFTLVNLSVVAFIIIGGLVKVDPSNWDLSKEEVETICEIKDPEAEQYPLGDGGFFPFGFAGVIRGAAACFYGFIGFDCIATAGEEAKNPQRSIPIAIVVSLLVIFFTYFGISTVLTMVIPYCLQDEEAPFPHMYETIGWNWARYIVTAGALCGLFSSLLGSMFPLPRIIYALSNDGLLFEFMGKVHPKFQTPFAGTLIAGVFIGCLACIFEISHLVKMMSIGTFFAYSVVAACVLVLRFSDVETNKKDDNHQEITFVTLIKQTFNTKVRTPTSLTSLLVKILVGIYFGLSFILAGLIRLYSGDLLDGDPLIICFTVLLSTIAILLLAAVQCQPRSTVKLSFTVPLLPWIPGLSIMINVCLMTTLDSATWIRFVVWIGIGIAIYFGYGIWNSKESDFVKLRESTDSIAKTNDKY